MIDELSLSFLFYKTCNLDILRQEVEVHAENLLESGYSDDGTPLVMMALLARVEANER